MYIRNGLWCCTLSNSGEQTCIFETDCDVVHCPTVGNKRVYSKRIVVLYTVQQWGTNMYIRIGLWYCTLSNNGEQTCIFETDCGVVHCPTVGNKRVYSKRTVVLYTVQQYEQTCIFETDCGVVHCPTAGNKHVYSKRTVMLYTVQQWGTNVCIRNGLWCCTLSNSGEQTCIFETDCGVVHCPTVGNKHVHSKRTVVLYIVQQWGTNIIFETDCGVVHCPTMGNKRVYSKRTVVLYTVQQWGTNMYIRNGLWCCTLSNSGEQTCTFETDCGVVHCPTVGNKHYIRNGLWCCTLSNSGEQTCIFETDCGVVHCPTVGNKRVYSKRTVVLYTVHQWGTNVYIRNGLWCCTLSNSGEETCIFDSLPVYVLHHLSHFTTQGIYRPGGRLAKCVVSELNVYL